MDFSGLKLSFKYCLLAITIEMAHLLAWLLTETKVFYLCSAKMANGIIMAHCDEKAQWLASANVQNAGKSP
jgi:hypothetical protein